MTDNELDEYYEPRDRPWVYFITSFAVFVVWPAAVVVALCGGLWR